VQRKPCPACTHPERHVIDGALTLGQAPRSVVKRYAGLSRKAVQRHRDERHHDKGETQGKEV
jgi:hypothetical protein